MKKERRPYPRKMAESQYINNFRDKFINMIAGLRVSAKETFGRSGEIGSADQTKIPFSVGAW